MKPNASDHSTKRQKVSDNNENNGNDNNNLETHVCLRNVDFTKPIENIAFNNDQSSSVVEHSIHGFLCRENNLKFLFTQYQFNYASNQSLEAYRDLKCTCHESYDIDQCPLNNIVFRTLLDETVAHSRDGLSLLQRMYEIVKSQNIMVDDNNSGDNNDNNNDNISNNNSNNNNCNNNNNSNNKNNNSNNNENEHNDNINCNNNDTSFRIDTDYMDENTTTNIINFHTVRQNNYTNVLRKNNYTSGTNEEITLGNVTSNVRYNEHVHVYTLFKFYDLSIMNDHFTFSKKSLQTYKMEDSGEKLVIFVNNTILHPNVGQFARNSNNGLSCNHDKSANHLVIAGWYIARRLKTGFAQFIREKQKYWQNLKYLFHREHPTNTIQLANQLCARLTIRWPSYCFNVQGNIVHMSTVNYTETEYSAERWLPDIPTNETIVTIFNEIFDDKNNEINIF